MIIALLALAFAMIVGGLLAVFFGWDIVLVERGWTMVLAGSISAAGGAIVLAITAAVSRLDRLQAEFARLQVDLGHPEPSQAEMAVREFGEEPLEADIDVREGKSSPGKSLPGMSLAALSGGLLGGKLFGRGTPKEEERPADLPLFTDEDRLARAEEIAETDLDRPSPKADEPLLPFPPRTTPEPVEAHDEEAEVKVPDFLLGDRLRETYVEAHSTSVEIFPYSRDEASDKREDEQALDERRDDVLEPEEEPAPEPEPAEAEALREPASTEEPRSATVIGTYNSGDNTYVMFSDGSIEAQTPGGVFRFQSLDELKQFIASGGEGGTPAT